VWLTGAVHIVSIREKEWKFARYYDPSSEITGIDPQYEMYNLIADPDEVNNIAFPLYNRTAEEQNQYDRLMNKLNNVIRTRLKPLPLERPLDLTVDRHLPGGDGGLLVTGTPVGNGNYEGVVKPKRTTGCNACRYRVRFTVWSDSGVIKGRARVTRSQVPDGSGGGTTTYFGYANITKGGTGAYNKIKGKNLLFNQTDKHVYIQGNVYF